MAYDFHYTPTGTGVISGKEVLEQTEDAINDLGNTAISGVQEALDKAEQALTNSENAVDDAQTALNTANNAEGVAIQAQTDVGNLSGTVTNIGNRVTTAEGNISNLQGRMTTAEGNITNLQGRMTTAETNIGNLQTAVSTAQATANSAQQTATTARQQSYVFRYSGTAVVPNSTIAYSTIDNTDNIKIGDKILDIDGKLFEITAVDTTNQTVTVGSALVDLALDSNVVHTSGNETVGGFKQFANIRATNSIKGINLDSTTTDLNNCYSDFAPYGESKSGNIQYYYCNSDSGTANISNLPEAKAFFLISITTRLISNSLYVKQILINSNNKTFTRYCNNGTWDSWVNETDKYVTIDTAQTISGNKVWTGTNTFQQNVTYQKTNLYHQAFSPCYILKDTDLEKGNLVASSQASYPGLWQDKNSAILGYMRFVEYSSGRQTAEFRVSNLIKNGALDPTGSEVNCTVLLELQPSGEKSLIPEQNNDINLGTSANKWKSFNGLTPSSLSLPSNTGYIDISGYLTNTGDGQTNSYTASVNGWIYLNIIASRLIMQISDSNDNNIYADMRVRPSDGTIYMIIPIGSGNKLLTQWFTSSSVTVTTARFIPCQGNI